jgi:hypothetical protein
MRSHAAAFAPLPTWQEEEEPLTPKPPFTQPYNSREQSGYMYNPYEPPATGNSTQIAGGPAVSSPLWQNPVYVTSGGGGESSAANARMTSPQAGEFVGFSPLAQQQPQQPQQPQQQYYQPPPGQDEARQPLTAMTPDDIGANNDDGHPSRGGDSPFWQQNRRESRNMPWM